MQKFVLIICAVLLLLAIPACVTDPVMTPEVPVYAPDENIPEHVEPYKQQDTTVTRLEPPKATPDMKCQLSDGSGLFVVNRLLLDSVWERDHITLAQIEEAVATVGGIIIGHRHFLGDYTIEVPATTEAELIAIGEQLMLDFPHLFYAFWLDEIRTPAVRPAPWWYYLDDDEIDYILSAREVDHWDFWEPNWDELNERFEALSPTFGLPHWTAAPGEETRAYFEGNIGTYWFYTNLLLVGAQSDTTLEQFTEVLALYDGEILGRRGSVNIAVQVPAATEEELFRLADYLTYFHPEVIAFASLRTGFLPDLGEFSD